MSFRITGLPAEPFAPLFALSEDELKAHGALRKMVDQPHAYPCRISLTDAEPGATVLLTHFEHHPVASPFRSSYAIYVREGEQTFDAIDEVPDQLRRRLLAARAFDKDGMLIGCDVAEGAALEPLIERLFADENARYLHIHFAKAGCYAAKVERA
ncbi:MAG TPA: DUF1203 domain-containing protein [Candidatus Udaeobacter sp.]|nr:DUF1203 domain-containing protein [Candidatus Udaeobacter sp.]